MEEWKEERGRAKKEGKRQRSCDLQILVQTAYIVTVLESLPVGDATGYS